MNGNASHPSALFLLIRGVEASERCRSERMGLKRAKEVEASERGRSERVGLKRANRTSSWKWPELDWVRSKTNKRDEQLHPERSRAYRIMNIS